jgi:hypothetical protein
MKQLDLFFEENRKKITHDIFQAYYDARRNKRKRL